MTFVDPGPAPVREIRIATGESDVTGLLARPANAVGLLLLAHGAGAGIRHRFFEALVPLLDARRVATLRYQFPYMERGRRRPDLPAAAQRTVRDAVAAAFEHAGDLPLLAGGKSFGGRMTSQAQAEAPLPGVRGLVFLGFPLHAAGKPDRRRAEHLARVDVPMLFVQGTRDSLASLDQLEPVVRALGARAALTVIDGGDHSFAVPKSAGRTAENVLGEVADAVARWAEARVGVGGAR
jgi:predicted alpha/beta-hydrolase family hydrolase